MSDGEDSSFDGDPIESKELVLLVCGDNLRRGIRL